MEQDAQANAAEAAANTSDAQADTQAAQTVEKTYTQAELDKIVAQQLKGELSKLPPKEKLEAFDKWQDSQKTAEELHEATKRQLEEAQAEILSMKRVESARKSGVDERFISFVNYEAQMLAKAENISFDEAFTRFMKEHGDVYRKQEPAPDKKAVRDVVVDTGAKGVSATVEKPKKMNSFW